MTANTITPWSSESLYAKALIYIEQMEASVADEWQYGLWSALSLELLARAALAHISPVLLADEKNWRNINFALGNQTTSKKFCPTSISTKEVLVRLGELIPGVTPEIAGFCGRQIDYRNAELHSGEVVFSKIGTSEWLPRFFQACEILLDFMNKELKDFFEDPLHVKNMINSLSDEASKAVKQDINAYSKVWSDKPPKEKDKASVQATVWATRHHGHRTQCPACGNPALLHGSPSGTVSTQIENQDVVQKQTMIPSTFECIACGLKISGYSKLAACNLGDAFSEKTTYSAAEFFELYTEDELEDAKNSSSHFEPDFNEF